MDAQQVTNELPDAVTYITALLYIGAFACLGLLFFNSDFNKEINLYEDEEI